MNARTLKGVRAAPVATAFVAALLTFSALPPSAAAQARAQPQIARVEEGVVGAGLLMRQLDGVKRVLMIGAHPDDEDTALLAILARGWGVETAYLALTRGDGGQNLIGNELFEGLGVVRTGELLTARGLDGGVQFFTRAYDFGYSNTADEALALWPREELLRDVTWVVRFFRPQVIVSVFSGTEADGHGQHQASGIMANDVFDVAGDATRYPQLLAMGVEPWQPLKLLRRPRGPGAETTLEVSTGSFDPLLGRSHFQLAMESRSQHRSQDQGQGQTPGPRSTVLELVKAAPGLPADVAGQAFLAGVDTTALQELEGREEDLGAPIERRLGESVEQPGLRARRGWPCRPGREVVRGRRTAGHSSAGGAQCPHGRRPGCERRRRC
jgi:LmbE family N-acetylglucosaminyl deacetylase